MSFESFCRKIDGIYIEIIYQCYIMENEATGACYLHRDATYIHVLAHA